MNLIIQPLKVQSIVKFVYSEKATKFCEIFTLLLSTVHTDKSKVNISQNFLAFSEYMNFKDIENYSPRALVLVGIFIIWEYHCYFWKKKAKNEEFKNNMCCFKYGFD